MTSTYLRLIAVFSLLSVLGFGGLLPDGNLFVVILFARAYIPHETAELFKTLALSAKLAVLPFVGGRVFDEAETTLPVA